jgi:hypothetical protein
MLKRNVNQKGIKSTEKIAGWDSAIQDAKTRIKRMRESIRVFQRMRDAGEPWHGGEAEQWPVETSNTKTEQHQSAYPGFLKGYNLEV